MRWAIRYTELITRQAYVEARTASWTTTWNWTGPESQSCPSGA